MGVKVFRSLATRQFVQQFVQVNNIENSHHTGPVMRKASSCYDVIMHCLKTVALSACCRWDVLSRIVNRPICLKTRWKIQNNIERRTHQCRSFKHYLNSLNLHIRHDNTMFYEPMTTNGGIAPKFVYDFRTTCEQIFLIKWNWWPKHLL